jgi:hypothetical protein
VGAIGWALRCIFPYDGPQEIDMYIALLAICTIRWQRSRYGSYNLMNQLVQNPNVELQTVRLPREGYNQASVLPTHYTATPNLNASASRSISYISQHHDTLPSPLDNYILPFALSATFSNDFPFLFRSKRNRMMKRRASPGKRRSVSGLMQRGNEGPSMPTARKDECGAGKRRRRDDWDGKMGRAERTALHHLPAKIPHHDTVEPPQYRGEYTDSKPECESADTVLEHDTQPPSNRKEQRDFGNLPLIDVWVAQAKGFTQEEIEALKGWTREEEEDGLEGDGMWPPIVQLLCDGRWADIPRPSWEGEVIEMIPDE